MKTRTRVVGCISLLLIVLLVAISWAGASGPVPDKRLIGQWHGQDRFYGMNYDEIAQKKVTIQDVETVLNIAADGKVTGRIGGAELSECVVRSNRGWIGRRLGFWSDFIIRGKLAGSVVPGAAGGIHFITMPFDLDDTRISGSVFAIRTLKYPYPLLRLRLSQ